MSKKVFCVMYLDINFSDYIVETYSSLTPAAARFSALIGEHFINGLLAAKKDEVKCDINDLDDDFKNIEVLDGNGNLIEYWFSSNLGYATFLNRYHGEVEAIFYDNDGKCVSFIIRQIDYFD